MEKREESRTKELPLIHSFIRDKMNESKEDPFCCLIKRTKVNMILAKYKIPKANRYIFLKEMEEYHFIKIKSKRKIEIL